MPVMFERKKITVEGLSSAYVDQGSGHPVVLIHGGEPGGPPGSFIWESNIDGLSKDYRVLAPDRLGQGLSENPATASDYRMSKLCDHVAAFMSKMNLGPATVVGQSRGAYVAAYLGMHYPDLVERVGFVNSASLAPTRPARHQGMLDNYKGDPETVRSDEEWLAVSPSYITDEWVAAARQVLSIPKFQIAKKEFKAQAEAYYQEFDTDKETLINWYTEGNFEKPSLLVWGIGDPMVEYEDGLALFDMLRKSRTPPRMHVMDRAGHSLFAENPREFNSLISGFIKST